jgi:trehalose 6-phosphate synthase/phosphatase
MASAITSSSGARTVLIVQKSLPLRLTRTPLAPPVDGSVNDGASFSWSAEWDDEALLNPRSALAAHESSLAAGRGASGLSKVRVTWIGMPAADVPPEDEEVVTRLLEPLGCIPVFLPPATARSFIDGYCRDTLYPVFHNVMDVYGEVPTRWWIKKRQSDRWKAYMDANQVRYSQGVRYYVESPLSR